MSTTTKVNDPRRHGFHFKCQTCGAHAEVGGIESTKQFADIIEGQIRRGPCHKAGHKYELKQSYHATEVAHTSITPITTRATSTNTAYTTPTGASIISANLTAGAKYLISVTAQLDISATTLSTKCKVIHGSTDFADSVAGEETEVTTNRVIYAWWTVWTAVSLEAINFQYAPSAAGTIGVDNLTMTAIKISELTENTDWFFAENATSTALTQAGDNGASVTFTPSAANLQWLVMGRTRIDTANATRGGGSRIDVDGDSTTSKVFASVEGDGATTEFFVVSTMQVFDTLTATSHTIAEESFSTGANAHNRTHSGIFVLNLNKFRNVAYAYTNNALTNQTITNYNALAQTVSITPDIQGDVWIYGFCSFNAVAAGVGFRVRLQLDNADVYGANTLTTEAYLIKEAFDATDDYWFNQQHMAASVTAASHTVDMDFSPEVQNASNGVQCRSLLAVTMEKAPNALAKVETETEGITETVTELQTAASAEMLHVRSRSGLTPVNITTATTRVRYGSGDMTFSSTETNSATRIRTDGAITNLSAKVNANTNNQAVLVYLRQNAANTALSVSVTASTTGHFSNSSNIIYIRDAATTTQELSYSFEGNAASTGTCSFAAVSSTFSHADHFKTGVSGDTIKSLAVVSNNGLSLTPTGPTTQYQAIISNSAPVSTETATHRLRTRIPSDSGGTLRAKNLFVYLSSNSRTTTTSIGSRVNGASGNLVVSVGSTATGAFEDTTHTDTLAEDALLSVYQTYGASAESLVVQQQKLELEQEVTTNTVLTDDAAINQTATMQNHSLLNMSSSSYAITENTTNYLSPGGSFSTATAPFGTVGEAEIPTLQPLKTIYRLAIQVNTNPLNSTASTLSLYKNGANINSAFDVSIPVSSTGAFVSSPAVYFATSTTASSDKLAYRLVVGTSSGGASTLSPSQFLVVSGAHAKPAIVILATESEGLTESTAKVIAQPSITANHVLHVGSRNSIGELSTANSTQYISIGTTDIDLDTTEANVQVKARTGFIFSNLQTYISANSAAGTSSVTLRKGGVDQTSTVSILTTQTGFFVDTGANKSVTIANGDLVNFKIVTGGATGTLTIYNLSHTIEDDVPTGTGKALSLWTSEEHGVVTANTFFFELTGYNASGALTESQGQIACRITGDAVTAKNYGINAQVNGNTSAATCTLRKNGADSALTASITANTTGTYDDTTHTESLSTTGGDLLCSSVTTSGTVNLTQWSKLEIEQTTNAPAISAPTLGQIVLGGSAAEVVNKDTTTYYPLGGGGPDSSHTNDNNVRVKTVPVLSTLSKLAAYIQNNLINISASTLLISKNSSDTTQSLSIGVGSSGQLVSTASAESTTADTDTVAYKFVTGSSSAADTISVRYMSIVNSGYQPGGAPQTYLKQIDESEGLTEDTPYVIGKIRPSPDESVGLTEASIRLSNMVRLTTESVGISESLAALQAKVRLVAESLGLTEETFSPRVLARQKDESVGLTESTLSPRVMSRQVDDGSVGLTEPTVISIKNMFRVIDESVGLSESVLSQKKILQQIDESEGLSESIAALRTLVRVLDESESITEDIIRLEALTRQQDESLGITESTIKALALVRQIDEASVALTESTATFRGVIRQVDEASVNLTEDTAIRRVMSRLQEESVGLTETVDRILTLVRQLETESVGLTELTEYRKVMVRLQEESVGLTETVANLRNLVRQIDESIGLAEAVNYLKAILQIVDESESLTETSQKIQGLVRQVDESGADITESIQKLAGIVRLSDVEAMGLTEAVDKIIQSTGAGLVKEVDESVGLTEAIQTIRTLVRVVDESISITESMDRLIARVRQVDESISLGEAYNVVLNLVRQIDEQVAVNEAISYVRGRINIINEATELGESLISNRALVRVADELIELADTVNAALAKVRVIDEQMGITELFSTVMGKIRQVNETLGILAGSDTEGGLLEEGFLPEGFLTATREEAIARLGMVKQADESLGLSEVVDKILTSTALSLLRQVDENVSLSEAPPIVLRGLNRLVSEDIGLVESLNKIGYFVRTVNESVILSEATEQLRTLVRVITESATVAEIAEALRTIRTVVTELISTSESTFSAKPKTKLILEAIQVLETTSNLLNVFVEPPPGGPGLERGGRQRRVKRRFQMRKGARYVQLGPRYYLSPRPASQQQKVQIPQPTIELLKQPKKRISELEPKLQTKTVTATTSCTCVYSIAAPSPSIESIISKIERNALLRQARQYGNTQTAARTLEKLQSQRRRLELELELEQKEVALQQQQLLEEQERKQLAAQAERLRQAIIEAALVRPPPPAIFLKQIISTSATAGYDIEELAKVSNTINVIYDMAGRVAASANASYNLKKGISPKHEQLVGFLQKVQKLFEIVDIATDRL